jgi:hypothetical protein
MGSVEPTSIAGSPKVEPKAQQAIWQYKAIAMPEGVLDTKVAWLNEIGSDGWELMFIEGWDAESATGIAWFKRPG